MLFDLFIIWRTSKYSFLVVIMTLFKGYKNVYYNLFYENVLFIVFKNVNMCSFLARLERYLKVTKKFLHHPNN